jgi:hypothetical protein
MLSKILKDIFYGAERIICPYCLSEVPVGPNNSHCANTECGRELPILYSQRYREVPPFFIQVVGWSQVGKTVFLQALTRMFEDITKIWPECVVTPDSEPTYEFLRAVRNYIEGGPLPPPTPLGLQEAYIMLLSNMPRWGGRTVVVRDCAGEMFDKLTIPVEQAPYLLHVPTTFVVVSIPDLRTAEGRNKKLDDLLISYITTMVRHKVDFSASKRSIVVVFSKADEIVAELPSKLVRYLENDEILEATNSHGAITRMGHDAMANYMAQMREMNEEIKDWVANDVAGLRLLRRAQEYHIELRFSLISSLGSKPDENNHLATGWQPRRVLDPYFWALDFQSR